ncbi:MAG: hypothetical protein AAFV26_08530 [Pseudomonadota bacterium]
MIRIGLSWAIGLSPFDDEATWGQRPATNGPDDAMAMEAEEMLVG